MRLSKTKSCKTHLALLWDVPRQNYQAVYKKVPVRVSRQVPKKVFQVGHSGVAPSEPTNTFVPEFVGSGTEIIDARERKSRQ